VEPSCEIAETDREQFRQDIRKYKENKTTERLLLINPITPF
jgi:hypothetical protein